MTEKVTCGRALVRLLEHYGVEIVFGIPGVHTLELYRGLAGSSIRHVLSRHEQGAGFMAHGYARASGKPGVCVVITGPGVTNAATPLGAAYADSVPLLLISSTNAVPHLGKGWGHLHEIPEQRALTAPITGFSATARAPDDVPDLMARAFSVFESSRPRPVHIEIPIDVLKMAVCREWQARPWAPRPAPPPKLVMAAAALLARAERPVIIAGGGALEAGGEIVKIAEKIGAALATTNAAKGVVPDSHPLCLMSTLCLPATQRFLAEADVVLALGTELAPTDTWEEELCLNGKLIRVDVDPSKMNDQYPAAMAVCADAAASADALLFALDQHRLNRSLASMEREVANVRHRNTSGHEPLQKAHIRVLEVVRRILPENGIVAADMTQIAYTANHSFPMERPRSWLYPVGFGTLGYALPAAIGAKLARPACPAVVLVGDSGLLYTVQELATAVELDLQLVVLLWNNEALGQIRDDMMQHQIPAIAVHPRNPDFNQLAQAFGCRAFKPGDLNQLESDLIEAVRHPGLSLIEVRQDMPDLYA